MTNANDAIAALRQQLAFEKERNERLYKENERLRWRPQMLIPDWNDLPERIRCELARIGEVYADDCLGGDLAVDFYGKIRESLQQEPPVSVGFALVGGKS